MPRAYSYIRFSTPQQAEGDSLRRQLEPTLTYVEKHGLELDQNLTFRDLGVSGFDGSNIEKGALGVFQQAIDSGRIPSGSYLIIESLDRLSRQAPIDALSILTSIMSRGIVVVTLMDQKEYRYEEVKADFTSLMYSLMIMQRAHEESLTKSTRVKAAWAERRKRGADVKLSKRHPGWLKLNEAAQQYDIIPEHKEAIEQIFNWYLDGFGDSTIVTKLNESEFKPMGRAKNWTPSTVKIVLTSRQVIGIYEPKVMQEVTLKSGLKSKRAASTGDMIEGYYPSVIDKDLFLQVQEARQKRVFAGGKKVDAMGNLFKGILKCGYCGSGLIVEQPNKNSKTKYSYSYMSCRGARQGVGCTKVRGAYDLFEKNFLMYCVELNLSELKSSTDTDQRVEIQKILLKLNDEIQLKEAENGRLLDAIASGSGAMPQIIITKMAELETQIAELAKEREGVKLKLEHVDTEDGEVQAHQVQIMELFTEMQNMSGDEKYQARLKLHALINRLVKEVKIFVNGHLPSDVDPTDLKLIGELYPHKYGQVVKGPLYEAHFHDLKYPRKVRMDSNNPLGRIHYNNPKYDEPAGMQEFVDAITSIVYDEREDEIREEDLI